MLATVAIALVFGYDKFFNDSGIPNETAWLNKAFQEFGDYADAYQTDAICLLDSALENKDLRDYNIYPAIFLIRHYISLDNHD